MEPCEGTDIVIVGGGFGGMNAALALDRRLKQGLRAEVTPTTTPPPMAVRKTKALPCAGVDSPEIRSQAPLVGLNFWARGFCVSTVGLDEAMVREYNRTQEEHEKKEEQVKLDY